MGIGGREGREGIDGEREWEGRGDEREGGKGMVRGDGSSCAMQIAAAAPHANVSDCNHVRETLLSSSK